MSAEGLLDDDEERLVREHIAGCPSCAAELSSLADVSRMLAEAPAPPLPEDVAARLEAVLRAEAEQLRASREANARLRSGAETPEPPSAGGGAVAPLRPRTGPARWMPYLAAAAAAVFVIGGGAAVIRGMMAPDPVEHTFDAEHDGGAPDAALPYRLRVVESGTEYTASALATQAEDVLAASPETTHGAESPADAPKPEYLDEETPDPSACLQRLDRSREDLSMVDLATFRPEGDGAPLDAWVMYFAGGSDGGADGPAGSTAYDVLVVSPGCAGGAGDTVLARATVTER
nr:zf-HC2 domain-containing protein [Nocardiopsis mwathae]